MSSMPARFAGATSSKILKRFHSPISGMSSEINERTVPLGREMGTAAFVLPVVDCPTYQETACGAILS